MKNILKNKDSSHMTIGLNVFSLITAVLLYGHIAGLLTWWALPITIFTCLIAYGSEIQPRKNSTNIKF